MVMIEVTIRCDHPHCTRSVRDEIPMFRPYFPNAFSAGWDLPHDGDLHTKKTYCPEHKGEPHNA